MAQSLQHFGRGALRVAKNYTKGYTETQTKVREATSNDPWGPSGTQMNELAQLSFNGNDFTEIMEMLDKRLNDKGKNWRHVFKALTVLDYILHAGSENVVIYFKENLYVIKTLKEFVYVDDEGKDVGTNVRQKAKDITNLLQDEERLRAARRQRGAMRDRMLGHIADYGALRGEEDDGARSTRRRNHRGREEDEEIQRAIALSIDSADDDARRRDRRQKEEDELAQALRLSEDEEAKRKKELEESNQRALTDDSFQLKSNNQYANQPQVDLFAQQPMGQMPVGYPLVDMTGFQQPMQAQYTSYNPFHAQMLAQQQQQQQQDEFMRQQMMAAEQQRQQEDFLRLQFMQQQQQLQPQKQQSLLAQPTGYGSNNPFAPKPPQATTKSFLDQPASSSSYLLQPSQSLSPQMSYLTPSSPLHSPLIPSRASPPPTTPMWQTTAARKDDGQYAGLANLLARGREDGLDTFGNIGSMRIPVGAPFAQSNRLAVQQTGAHSTNNPFARQQQSSDQPFFTI